MASDLGGEAGIYELEKAAVQKDPSLKDKVYYTLGKSHNARLQHLIRSLTALPVGGGDAQEEIRNHLDSGVLAKLFAVKEKEMLKPPKHAWMPGYAFILLGACAMTLGCRIPERYKLSMRKHFLHVDLMETAERQISKALNGPEGYQDGVPYRFEVPEDVQAAHEAEMEAREARAKATGGFVMMNVPSPGGLFAGPPKNKSLRDAMDEAKFGDAGCGGCGAAEKDDGGDLLRCGKCKKRGYCGAECQKEHWKLHKKFCKSAEGGKEKAK